MTRAVHLASADRHGESPVGAVWLPCDSDTDRINREHGTTFGEPFLALPYEARRVRGALMHKFSIFREHLPRVVVVDGWTGKVGCGTCL